MTEHEVLEEGVEPQKAAIVKSGKYHQAVPWSRIETSGQRRGVVRTFEAGQTIKRDRYNEYVYDPAGEQIIEVSGAKVPVTIRQRAGGH